MEIVQPDVDVDYLPNHFSTDQLCCFRTPVDHRMPIGYLGSGKRDTCTKYSAQRFFSPDNGHNAKNASDLFRSKGPAVMTVKLRTGTYPEGGTPIDL
jgi:hypothetical protein